MDGGNMQAAVVYRCTMHKRRGDAAAGPAARDAAVLATELALTLVSLGVVVAPGGLKEAGGKEEAALSFGSAAADSFLSKDICK
jgi:hypothetical protein